MIKNKIITYISFAKKAGSLYVGFDSVKSSILSNKAKLVILLKDISEKTQKEIIHISNIYDCKYVFINLTSENFKHIFYKKVVVISIDDKNLSSAILNQIKDDND